MEQVLQPADGPGISVRRFETGWWKAARRQECLRCFTQTPEAGAGNELNAAMRALGHYMI